MPVSKNYAAFPNEWTCLEEVIYSKVKLQTYLPSLRLQDGL